MAVLKVFKRKCVDPRGRNKKPSLTLFREAFFSRRNADAIYQNYLVSQQRGFRKRNNFSKLRRNCLSWGEKIGLERVTLFFYCFISVKLLKNTFLTYFFYENVLPYMMNVKISFMLLHLKYLIRINQ